MAPVNIRVTSTMKGFVFPGGIYPVDDTTLTWREVLEKIGLHLYPSGKYWISNASKKILAVPENQVEEFIKQFKHPMDPYIVSVSKANAQTQAKHALKTKEVNEKRPQDVGTPVRPIFARVVRHHADLGEELASSAPKRARAGTSSFAEDGPEFPNDPESPQVVHDIAGDFDDAASILSQDSQDSQDGGEDFKASIVRKLMLNISSGDLVVIKKEFLKMKDDGRKTMKVARHIPTVLNFLGVLFANEPNAD